MNMKMIAGACLCATAIVGCVSVEQTRQQLQSKDSAEVKKAEENIFRIATEGRDPSGFVQFTPQQQVEYVDLTSNNDLLLKILDKSYRDEVILAAAKKLDFSKAGLSGEILSKHKGIIEEIQRAEEKKGIKDSEGFTAKVLSNLTEQELVQLLKGDLDSRGGWIDSDMKRLLVRQLVEVTQDSDILYNRCVKMDGDLHSYAGAKVIEKAVEKLVAITANSDDIVFIAELLDAKGKWADGYRKDLIENVGQRKILFESFGKALDKKDEGKAAEILLPILKKKCFWSEYYTIAAQKAKSAKDAKVSDELSFAVLSAIANSYKRFLEESTGKKSDWSFSNDKVEWSDWQNEDAMKLVSLLPAVSNSMVARLIDESGDGVILLIGMISPEVAYATVAEGKAKTQALELELVKRLPREKMDLKVYKGACSDAAKKAIYAAMSPELQKQVHEANDKAFAGVVEKAKSASKETFELEGFYLGMSWEDMKIVLAHHFPDYKIEDKRDGEDEDSAWVIYLPDQRSPFCYADAKEKKVYQFNFGKKMLKKWYKYDVQNYAQWAIAYSRENKIDMQYKMVEKEATVYEPMDMSRSYRVWFYQHSYQYKHNEKEYRLTYFGDEKDFTVHGGIGGALIKEQAAPKFRYVRGDPGSLRAKIERD